MRHPVKLDELCARTHRAKCACRIFRRKQHTRNDVDAVTAAPMRAILKIKSSDGCVHIHESRYKHTRTRRACMAYVYTHTFWFGRGESGRRAEGGAYLNVCVRCGRDGVLAAVVAVWDQQRARCRRRRRRSLYCGLCFAVLMLMLLMMLLLWRCDEMRRSTQSTLRFLSTRRPKTNK